MLVMVILCAVDGSALTDGVSRCPPYQMIARRHLAAQSVDGGTNGFELTIDSAALSTVGAVDRQQQQMLIFAITTAAQQCWIEF